MKNTRAYIMNNPDYFDYLVNKVENFGKIDVEVLSEEEVEAIEAENKLYGQAVEGAEINLDEILAEADAPKKKTAKKK